MSNATSRARQAGAIAVAMCCAGGFVDAAEHKTARVAEGVYALMPAAQVAGEDRLRRANAAFVVGPRGVAVIDTGISYREGLEIIAAVRRVTRRPIRLAILTHPSQEAIFGAAAFQARGIPILMHRAAAALMASRCETCLGSLKAALGDDAMAGTRVVTPDRLIEGDQAIDAIGRRLRVIAPAWSSAPGALAVLDERTSTLIAGSIISIRSVPDTRDADARGWRNALVALAATHCSHLVSSFGAIGRCSDIDVFARYFTDLEARVAQLLRDGVSLADLDDRCDMPEYAGWDRYDALHKQNAGRAYLRLERLQFDIP
jgi:glyoxylase-like metal-dependent hydrolase (beta-lactamase superfamily II)